MDPAAPIATGDHDGDAIPDLMVKFSRGALELSLPEGGDVNVSVTGTVDGQSFAGTEGIRVIRGSVSAPLAGSHVAAGSVTQIRWQMPWDVTAESVALLQSINGGATWSLIARGRPNTGTYDWAVPNVRTDQAKLADVLECADGTGDGVDGVIAVSKAFFVDAVVGVGEGGGLQFALDTVHPNPARGDQLQVQFVLAREGSARLELLDVAGRRVVAREVGALGVGRHQSNPARTGSAQLAALALLPRLPRRCW